MAKNKTKTHKSQPQRKRVRKPKVGVTFDREDNGKQKLIELVEPHKCLYDANCNEKRFFGHRKAAWETVASEFGEGITPEQCGVQWRVLRGSYRRVFKALKDDPTALPSWPHYPMMAKVVR